MLPILTYLESLPEGEAATSKQVYAFVRERFALSDEDLTESISRGQLKYVNNASWACSYLKNARVIETVKRGVYRMTDRGKELLASHPKKIDRHVLSQYEEFRSFLNRSHKGARNPSDEDSQSGVSSIADEGTDQKDDSITPEESIATSIEAINEALASELLECIMQQDPMFFEQLVVDLLIAMGYGDSWSNAGTVTKRSGDEGIDGIVRGDKLGFDNIYIQAKRFDPSSSVGRPTVQGFVGALTGAGATKGLFITTARFTREACEFAERQHAVKLVLVDGKELTQLMIAHGLGVYVKQRYELKGIDRDYFNE